MACTEKNQICWWQRNLWENFIKVRSPVLPDFWISETTKFFRKRSNWSDFLVVYWRSSHRRPPANVPRLGQPGLAPPIYLPPHFPPKKQNKKSVLFYKREKKSLLLLTPIFSLISPSSNGYSCYVIFPLDSINGILLPKLFWPTVRKKLKFEAESREFSKLLRPLEQFIQTVKGQNNFW